MKKRDEKSVRDPGNYQRTNMEKKIIIQKLRDKGGRVTRQRMILLDIILENECSCCKEIYFRAVSKGEKIGLATVYRMVNTLEEIGAISRQNMYKIVCGEDCEQLDVYTVEFTDGTVAEIPEETWYQIVRTGLKEWGYMKGRELHSVRMKTCDHFESLNAVADCK